ncbi:hypothetical protein PAPYR_6353 [Paratrimastix pyriformis]|uniref:Fungal lipase-like domain-containing protein n=1 Tax=Paratrimastix pyriformis TaxID=342808 RepID=A0ABQ8UFQ3_9EUKA|nr:hypothetical protein PAPYR_6353 [Paratrimastix pyriformis]
MYDPDAPPRLNPIAARALLIQWLQNTKGQIPPPSTPDIPCGRLYRDVPPQPRTLFERALHNELDNKPQETRELPEPYPMEHSFWTGVNDDFQRLCAILCSAIEFGSPTELLEEVERRTCGLSRCYQSRNICQPVSWHPSGLGAFVLLNDPAFMSSKKIAIVVFRSVLPEWKDPRANVTSRLDDLAADLLAPYGVDIDRGTETTAWVDNQIQAHRTEIEYVFFTGFAMGGFLAESMALRFARADRNCAAVLFNAPGPHAFFHSFVGLFASGHHKASREARPFIVHHRIPGDPASAVESGLFSGTEFYEWEQQIRDNPHTMDNFLPWAAP